MPSSPALKAAAVDKQGKQVWLRLHDDEIEELELVARLEHRSRSGQLRFIVRAYVRRRRDRALRLDASPSMEL